MSARTLIASIVALLPVVIGCAAETVDSTTLEEGLNVLHAEEGTLSLAFKQGDDVIFMEALRGQSSLYPDEPEMPSYEVDALFTDDQGEIFYSRRGGDHFLDPSWAADLQAQTDAAPKPASESNEYLFELAETMAQTLQQDLAEQVGDELAEQLAPELNGLLTFAENATAIYEESVQTRLDYLDTVHLIETPPVGDVEYGTNGPEDAERSFGSNYYYVGLHAKGIVCVLGLCGGDHSATSIHEWKGYWAKVHDFCNHGECASGMSRKDLLQYYEPVGNSYKPQWHAQTCDTHYDWDSSGGGHNCHDDSRLQMNNFVFDSTIGGSQYWCNDGSTDKWKRPSANGDDDEGYNHPSYCDYDFGSENSCPSSYQGTGDGCDCGCVFPDGTFADPDCHP